MSKLTHTDAKGKANMVDVGNKPDQERVAVARGRIDLGPETIELIRENQVKKGDVLTVAEIAGIQGGKMTSHLIPLCHPLQLTKLEVETSLLGDGVEVTATARCIGKTGVKWRPSQLSASLCSRYMTCARRWIKQW